MKKALFGLAESQAQAVSIFNQLLGAGFSDNDISVLFPDETGTRHFAHEKHTKAPEGAAAGAGAGGIIGGGSGLDRGYWDIDDPGCGTVHSRGSNHGRSRGRGCWRSGGRLNRSSHRPGNAGI